MTTESTKTNKKINKGFSAVLAVLVVSAVSYGIYSYIYSLSHESTDNAQIEAKVNPVIPHVSGYVEAVYVKDNQFVKKGDTLLTIDSSDYVLLVKEAEAGLAAAKSSYEVAVQNVKASKSQVSTSAASILGAEATIDAAQVRVWRATKDFERYENLWKDKVITQQQYEQALAEKQSAEKQLAVLQEQKNIADKQKNATASMTDVSASQLDVAKANISKQEAMLERARLNLSYCIVTAPSDGQVSVVEISKGQLVQAGQSLFNLVLMNDLWVVANFKETQMTDMRDGQKVSIEVDAYPGKEYTGTVNSISPATGALFSIIPPDNATGNFVKIVQRVPIRINLDKADKESMSLLRPGLSVEVEVTTK